MHELRELRNKMPDQSDGFDVTIVFLTASGRFFL
jgi:hypothetical protein